MSVLFQNGLHDSVFVIHNFQQNIVNNTVAVSFESNINRHKIAFRNGQVCRRFIDRNADDVSPDFNWIVVFNARMVASCDGQAQSENEQKVFQRCGFKSDVQQK